MWTAVKVGGYASQLQIVYDPQLQGLIDQAKQAETQGNTARSIELHRQAIRLQPLNTDLVMELIRLFIGRLDVELSVDFLTDHLTSLLEALEHQPMDSVLWLQVLRVQLAIKQAPGMPVSAPLTPRALIADSQGEPQPICSEPSSHIGQIRERQRFSNPDYLSIDGLPQAQQFTRALRRMQNAGLRPLIVDAGTVLGLSSQSLATRYPEAQVVALLRRSGDQATVASEVDDPAFEIQSCATASELHETILQLLTQPSIAPALLHLDAEAAVITHLFSPLFSSDWIGAFPVVIIEHGGTHPQPYLRALAHHSFHMIVNGELLLAFNRSLLSGLAASDYLFDLETRSDLVPLNGELVVDDAVVGFDGEWQGPAITEQQAFQRAHQLLRASSAITYLGFPWASLIDHLNAGTPKGIALLRQLADLRSILLSRGCRRISTVCQQIYLPDHRWFFEWAGVTDVFWSHATIFQSESSLRLHPFPLFPVHWHPSTPASSELVRDLLYSFVGARGSQPLYLTNSRDLILSCLGEAPDTLVHANEEWFFEALVYGRQIFGNVSSDDPRVQGTGRADLRALFMDALRRSIFTLCPSGAGPNSIRLWEAIGSGSIPVILSDTYRPPGPRELWDEAVVFVPDTELGVLSLPTLLRRLAADGEFLASKRAGLVRLWQRYSPETFITDIQDLHASLAARH